MRQTGVEEDPQFGFFSQTKSMLSEELLPQPVCCHWPATLVLTTMQFWLVLVVGCVTPPVVVIQLE